MRPQRTRFWHATGLDRGSGGALAYTAPVKWLLLAGLLAAGGLFLVAPRLARTAEGRRSLYRIASLAGSYALLGAAVYAAHAIGLSIVPIVALAFVPVAVTIRSLVRLTRARRARQRTSDRGSVGVTVDERV